MVKELDALAAYVGEFRATGELLADVGRFLGQHGCEQTFVHVQAVAAKAVALAEQFGGAVAAVKTAALLHDISAVIPNRERLGVARGLGLAVLPEEETFPMIVHQKLSVPMARELFGVTNEAALSAIGCHTTLKAQASLTDKLVFVADKIAWDQAGVPPYLAALEAGLEDSLETAVLVYLDYLWEKRATLRVLHPWAIAARNELRLFGGQCV